VTSLPIITQSEIRTFRRCAREHHLAYGEGLRPAGAEAAPLRFGSAVHEGLARWWLGADIGECLDVLDGMEPYERAQAASMLVGYAAYWQRPAGNVLAVEREFRCPLVNPATGHASMTYQLAGKVDAVTSFGGRVLLVEHKTSSEDITPGSPYWQRLRIDTQVPIYLQGVRSMGWEPAGCLYDVLGKPKLRPKKGETADAFYERLCDEIASNPARYFQQLEITVLAADEADALADAWATARQMREAQLQRRWPRNSDACVRWSRPCSYFGLCTGQSSVDRFIKTIPHQELTHETV
jgi:hypothetical protein